MACAVFGKLVHSLDPAKVPPLVREAARRCGRRGPRLSEWGQRRSNSRGILWTTPHSSRVDLVSILYVYKTAATISSYSLLRYTVSVWACIQMHDSHVVKPVPRTFAHPGSDRPEFSIARRSRKFLMRCKDKAQGRGEDKSRGRRQGIVVKSMATMINSWPSTQEDIEIRNETCAVRRRSPCHLCVATTLLRQCSTEGDVSIVSQGQQLLHPESAL